MTDEIQILKSGRTVTYLVNGKPLCWRKTRNATAKYENCHKPAGWATDHVGSGACKLHGGKAGRPMLNGKYSHVKKTRLKESFERFANDPHLMNMDSEIAWARALLSDLLERHDTTHDEEDILRIIELEKKMIDSIITAIEKRAKVEDRHTMTVAQARLLMLRAIDVQKKWLEEMHPDEDPERIKELLEDWLQVWRAEVEKPLGLGTGM